MKLRNTGIPLIIDDIIEVEKRMDLLFPTEFKDFYLQHNGGNPERNKYYKWNKESQTRINSFERITKEGTAGPEELYKNMVRLESYLPIGIIPFANDDTGNMFCISARENDYGHIYYCDNENASIDDQEECLTLLDKSLKHFIDNLV